MSKYAESTNHKLESDSGASAPPPSTPDGDVTPATPSQVDTAAPRQKAPRSKKAKPRSADKPGPESTPDEVPLRPFAFGNQLLSEAVFAQIQAACALEPEDLHLGVIKLMNSVMSIEK